MAISRALRATAALLLASQVVGLAAIAVSNLVGKVDYAKRLPVFWVLLSVAALITTIMVAVRNSNPLAAIAPLLSLAMIESLILAYVL